MRAIAVLVVSGCWSAAAPAPATTAPDAPAPILGWSPEQRRFTVTGLPAVASDGSAIVLAHVASDGARGNPNLTLEARDRADQVVDRLVVVETNEGDALVEDTAALASRIAQGQRWLHEQAAKRHLAPLADTALEETATPHVANGAGLTVDWLPGIFELRRDGRVLTSQQTPASWLARSTDRCENPAFLAGAWVDPARPIALVKIDYRGTDSCWEPDPQEHVIAW